MAAAERTYMRVSINNAWVKMNQYYILLAESPLFTASVILHPGYGLRWLKKAWAQKDQWVADAEAELGIYFERWYHDTEHPSSSFSAAPSPSPSPSLSPSPASSPGPRQAPRREPPLLKEWMKNRVPYEDDGEEDGELQRYYRLRINTNDVDAIQWWVDRRAEFLRLSRLALDILAIPAMAADCERVFSVAKLMITSQRHALHDDTIERMQMLKHWAGEGAISFGGGFSAQHHG